MRPLLQHPPTAHNENNIRLLHRRKPMRNRDHGPPALASRPLNRRLDQLLALAVERRRRLVQQEESRLPQQRTCEAESLLLAAGQAEAFGAEARGVAGGEAGDEGVDLGVCAGCLDFGVCCVGDGEGDVFGDGAFVEGGFLWNEADLLAVEGWGEGCDVLPVEEDRAGCGRVEALEERDGGAFAAAGCAD